MIKTYWLLFVSLFFVLFCHASVAVEQLNASQISQQCLSAKWQKVQLQQLKVDQFQLTELAEKQALMLQLLNCLASPDPELRDDIAYSAISQWLRQDRFDDEVYLRMFKQLLAVLSANVIDKHNVYQPFAALALSEIVRVDRITPYLTDAQRQQVINVVSDYFLAINDYRGFEQGVGWRHSIAHSADVFLQLALNQAISSEQLTQMLNVLSQQINANGQHFYVYGESRRIAMAVTYILLRQTTSVQAWQEWLDKITSPAPFASWQAVYSSQQGLVKLHNTQSFLTAMFALIKNSNNQTLQARVPALERALKLIQ